MKGRIEYLRTIGAGELSGHRLWEAVLRRVRDLPHLGAWHLSGKARRSRAGMATFLNRHRGERCVIVANGPSLKQTPLHLLEGETIIGMNRVHLLKREFGFLPDYAVVSDIVSQLQHIADDLADLDIPKFVNWNGRDMVNRGDFFYFKTTFRPRFSVDFPDGIYGGHSVTYASLQLAYYMGFAEVVLVGKDHSYAVSGRPTAPIKSDGQEKNHFAAGYYSPGQLWRIPDYKGEEMAYAMAREAFEVDGRRVIDATVGGHLEVFPKVELAAALG